MQIRPTHYRDAGQLPAGDREHVERCYIVTLDQLHQLAEAAIEAEMPPLAQSCDWLNSMRRNPIIYPLAVYRTIERYRTPEEQANG